MNKFKIGDKVRVVTTYIYPNNITRLEYIDKIMTIKELLKHGDYKVEENTYGWRPNDLELIEQDTKEDTPTDKEIETDTSYEDTKEDTPKEKVIGFEELYHNLEKSFCIRGNEIYTLTNEIKDLKDTIEIQADIILQQALINAKGNND